ncbi:MAG: M14 family zinc carboxypeptidase, partial [Gammaproteobacteria bacterium]
EATTLDNAYRVYFTDRLDGYKLIRTFHSEALEVNYAEGFVVMMLTDPLSNQLTERGFRIEPAWSWRSKRRAQITEAKSRLNTPAINTEKVSGRSTIAGFACYEDVETTLASAQELANQFPQLASLVDIGDSWNKENGLGGYDLVVLKITNQAVLADKPVLFIQSAMHAREYATAALTLSFAQQLLNNYGTDPDITWIVDYHDIQILLQANPDGRKMAEAGVLWRKNTNINHCPEALPGVDLNRNYTFFWQFDEIGSRSDECSEIYRGSLPSSEPETKSVEEYIRNLYTDRRGLTNDDAAPADTSGIHLDIHSFGELILWPWGHMATPSANQNQLQTLGRKLAYLTNYFPTQSFGIGATNGTSDEVSYGELGVAAYTIELGTTFFQDCATYENIIKNPNLDALMYAAKVSRSPYKLPSGPDITLLTLNNGRNITLTAGETISVTVIADDSRFSTSNGTETTQAINQVNVYLDTPPWLAEAADKTLLPADGNADSISEMFTDTLTTTDWTPGEKRVYFQAIDANGSAGPISAALVKVLEPLANNIETPPPVSTPAPPVSGNLNSSTSNGISLSDANGGVLTWPTLVTLILVLCAHRVAYRSHFTMMV